MEAAVDHDHLVIANEVGVIVPDLEAVIGPDDQVEGDHDHVSVTWIGKNVVRGKKEDYLRSEKIIYLVRALPIDTF